MSALLEIEDLAVTFGDRSAAVRGASFRVEKGETHCLVGEPGCGKSVTALAIMNLLARGGERSAKRMSFADTDLLSLSDREMARLRGNRISVIFQEPMTSLNPAFTIGSRAGLGVNFLCSTMDRKASVSVREIAAFLLQRWSFNPMMTRIGYCLTLLLGMFASEASAQMPGFLPSYYQEALQYDGKPLELISQSDKEVLKRAVFESRGTVGVTIEQIACERAQCAALLEQNLKRHNERMGAGGTFRIVSASEYVAVWSEDSKSILMYFAKLPAAIEVWTRVTREGSALAEEPYVSDVSRVLNRRRYDDAKQRGNVDTGVWQKEIAQHVHDLRAAQKNDEALAVLAQLIVWAPSNLDAQIEFAEMTKDATAARASALVVWDHAEDEKLRAHAAKPTGLTEPKFEARPVLEPGWKGLRVVLVPLPRCDIRLIEEVARQFSASFAAMDRVQPPAFGTQVSIASEVLRIGGTPFGRSGT